MAFGTLKADTLTHSTAGSVDTNYVVNGSAKAWVNYTSSTTTSARDSFNVASLTDNATGKTTVSYSNSMATANYSCPTSCSNGDASSTENNLDPHTFLAGSTNFNSFANSALNDRDNNLVTTHGDLA